MANSSSLKKWVYQFSREKTEGNQTMRSLLGGKGANLAEMAALGLPVPPGLTVTTEACLDFNERGQEISSEVREQVLQGIKAIEDLTGKKFGDPKNPLLFSVRSGSRASMPGMMDTVLNLGINDETVQGLCDLTKNDRFAWDSYRRFIQMYAHVVMEFNVTLLEMNLEDLKEARGVVQDTELTASDLKELVGVYKKVILEESGASFPQDPMDQLWRAIAAVFRSWNNPRAQKYRELNNIPHDWGTAVNVQSMVFGNMGDDSATGVCFTRNPSTGAKSFFGEYLINAQGEDVVAGTRTPAPINDESKNESNKALSTLKELMPESYGELVAFYQKLEKHYKDMQDIEFTIEKGVLYILQTRSGKRTARAALRIATELVEEGVLTPKEAVLRVRPEDLNQLLHPRLDPKAEKNILAQGLPASPGAASGEIVLTAEKAHNLKEEGRKVLLVRLETSPEDIAGMVAAEGILTSRGGMTSHAAVVARGMGKPCVAGCSEMSVNYQEGRIKIKGKDYYEGDFLTIDGATGEVMEGEVPTIEAEFSPEFQKFMKWADEIRRLKVRTNADNPTDCEQALKFGAEGIGLCRTEHMFFGPERIMAIREMIFSQTKEKREEALQKLFPFQKEDFLQLFKAMNGWPVNIRLLDPPLHEFLPQSKEDRLHLAKHLDIELKELEERMSGLHEFNPMLGHRGCRLAITYPEIYKMQVKAIISAALECQEQGIKVEPEIMIPLIAMDRELEILRRETLEVAEALIKNKSLKYKIGTMIELPRAAITADQIAEHADFFSFGTNDLTQTTYGLSRDDAGKFLPEYIGKGLFQIDPFVSLDQSGVGFLVELAFKKGKEKNPRLHIGICGEHGGDPHSVIFCHNIGLDYVSCSPFRVPIARLSAAQAAVLEQNQK